MKSKTEKHFDNIANDYENSNNGNFCKPFYGEILKRILKEDSNSVLDLGCGTGIILKELEKHKNIKLSGLDI